MTLTFACTTNAGEPYRPLTSYAPGVSQPGGKRSTTPVGVPGVYANVGAAVGSVHGTDSSIQSPTPEKPEYCTRIIPPGRGVEMGSIVTTAVLPGGGIGGQPPSEFLAKSGVKMSWHHGDRAAYSGLRGSHR